MVSPSKPASLAVFSVQEGFDETTIIIPALRPPIIVGFLSIWLTVWIVFGGQITWYEIGDSRDVYLVEWQLVWLLGLICVVTYLLWFFTGKETIHLKAGEIVVSKSILGVPIVGRYQCSKIRTLHLVLENPKKNMEVPRPFQQSFSATCVFLWLHNGSICHWLNR
jgi:hypothetical protein